MKAISDNIKPILALFVMVCGMGYIFLTTFIQTKNQDSQGLIAMINFMCIALGYYLGTSTGTSKKDDLIQDLANKK